jgi:DNA adenine methylase
MFTEPKLDATALERQHRRIGRLKAQGVVRSTVLVHRDCKSALEGLRPFLVDPIKGKQLALLTGKIQGRAKPINVAQVRQLSPLRYPGGKTWLIPEVRNWLMLANRRPSVLVEPFAGGAMVGLTVAAEDLSDRVFLCELDVDVAALWETIFQGTAADVRWLCDSITSFEVNLEKVRGTIASEPKATKARAFRTIVKNRMQRGGIMAAGAGLVKSGEAGRGLHSRWYPETLATRINALHSLKDRISFERGDGFDVIRRFANDSKAAFFIDPPYTAGGKKAGNRLYTHNEIDHEGLFALTSKVRGCVMLTYDDAPEVRKLAKRYGFRIVEVPMKNTHHAIIRELLILKP